MEIGIILLVTVLALLFGSKEREAAADQAEVEAAMKAQGIPTDDAEGLALGCLVKLATAFAILCGVMFYIGASVSLTGTDAELIELLRVLDGMQIDAMRAVEAWQP
jgi:hypothetical protein